jgi:Protein of unknown function (DUF3540)
MLTLNENHAVAAKDSQSLRSSSGAYAKLTADEDGELLRVYSNAQKLIFEYDALSGKTSVYIPSGDLEFVTQQGDIVFTSARALSLRAHTVQVTGHTRIRISVNDMLGRILSGLTLQSQHAKLSSRKIDVTAHSGEFQIDEANWTAKKIFGRGEHIRVVAGKVERFANSVIERTKDVYATVDGVVQLKAGRLRTLLTGTYHFKAKRAYMKADEDFKINADRIHLG